MVRKCSRSLLMIDDEISFSLRVITVGTTPQFFRIEGKKFIQQYFLFFYFSVSEFSIHHQCALKPLVKANGQTVLFYIGISLYRVFWVHWKHQQSIEIALQYLIVFLIFFAKTKYHEPKVCVDELHTAKSNSSSLHFRYTFLQNLHYINTMLALNWTPRVALSKISKNWCYLFSSSCSKAFLSDTEVQIINIFALLL